MIGCDSMLLIDGELQGKPADADAGHGSRWRQMSGRDGALLTGHAVRRVVAGRVVAVRGRRPGRPWSGWAGRPTPNSTPTSPPANRCGVAGALTIDGFGGWFVDGVDGDPSQRARHLAAADPASCSPRSGVSVTDLWRTPVTPATGPGTTRRRNRPCTPC